VADVAQPIKAENSTFLHYAVRGGSRLLVDCLISECKVPVDLPEGKQRLTALNQAVKLSNKELVQCLIGHGADVALLTNKQRPRLIPLLPAESRWLKAQPTTPDHHYAEFGVRGVLRMRLRQGVAYFQRLDCIAFAGVDACNLNPAQVLVRVLSHNPVQDWGETELTACYEALLEFHCTDEKFLRSDTDVLGLWLAVLADGVPMRSGPIKLVLSTSECCALRMARLMSIWLQRRRLRGGTTRRVLLTSASGLALATSLTCTKACGKGAPWQSSD
jgi:hypothetical protein